MTKAQEKYTKQEQTEQRKAQDLRNEPKTHTSEDQNGHRAGGLHPDTASPPPRVVSTTGDLEELQGTLLAMHRAIEQIEVQAAHVEQMVMSKDGTQTSPMNTAQVAKFDESATLAGRMSWLNHRLNHASDRLAQGTGRLQSLIAN